jgi:hypothetical protein
MSVIISVEERYLEQICTGRKGAVAVGIMHTSAEKTV